VVAGQLYFTLLYFTQEKIQSYYDADVYIHPETESPSCLCNLISTQFSGGILFIGAVFHIEFGI
jgi:hypothetical protein